MPQFSICFFKACLLRDLGTEWLSIFHCFERVIGFDRIGKRGVTEQVKNAVTGEECCAIFGKM